MPIRFDPERSAFRLENSSKEENEAIEKVAIEYLIQMIGAQRARYYMNRVDLLESQEADREGQSPQPRVLH